jgi:hypothetical protein
MSTTVLPPTTPPTGGDVAGAVRLLMAAVAALVEAEPTQAQLSELGDHLVELQAGIDSLTGVASRWTRAFEDAGGHEEAGSATLAAWMRQHLRLTVAESRKRARAGRALDCLPGVREAVHEGDIGTAHVDAIAAGVHMLGTDVIAGFEDIMLEVARTCDADAVRQTIRKIRDTLDPDAADAAYVHALERRDVKITPVGEG